MECWRDMCPSVGTVLISCLITPLITNPTAPLGTIIHPSIYLILDEYPSATIDVMKSPFYAYLERWRRNALGLGAKFPEPGIWNERGQLQRPVPRAIRILVCWKTGVGKSSLINTVFGLFEEVASESHFSRGIHNIREEIVWPNRPDIIIHDSRGFEAGGVEESTEIEDFLREKSAESDLTGAFT